MLGMSLPSMAALMIVVCQSIAQPAIRMEFEGRGVTQLFAVSLSSAVGLLVGGESTRYAWLAIHMASIGRDVRKLTIALVWGLSAESVGYHTARG